MTLLTSVLTLVNRVVIIHIYNTKYMISKRNFLSLWIFLRISAFFFSADETIMQICYIGPELNQKGLLNIIETNMTSFWRNLRFSLNETGCKEVRFQTLERNKTSFVLTFPALPLPGRTWQRNIMMWHMRLWNNDYLALDEPLLAYIGVFPEHRDTTPVNQHRLLLLFRCLFTRTKICALRLAYPYTH